MLSLNTVSGLIQTTDYATALIGNGPHHGDKLEIERLVEARLIRRQLLEKQNAPKFRFLIHETLLHQEVGGQEVVAGQLQRLLEVIEYSHIELRILPMTTWAHTASGMTTDYTIFELREPFPDVVGMETSAGALYAESPDIDLFTTTYDALWQNEALDHVQTVERIEIRLKEVSQ